MKKMKLNTLSSRAIAAGFVVGALMAAQGAFACVTDNWSTTSGSPLASGPAGPDGKAAIARYSGVCAMQAGDGAVEFVEDQSPGGIDRIRARFYVLANHTENAVVYQGLNAGGTEVFHVLILADGRVWLRSGGVDAKAEGANAGVLNAWNSIELDWNAGVGEMSLTVNGGTPVPASIPSGATVDRVRLGNLIGAAGTLNFDAYESRRSTAVGTLCACDANASGDDVVNIQDFVVTTNEAGGTSLASGQPDCNGNGSVDIQDMVAIINIAGSTGSCGSL